jgi:DsbC/DsbD-like thiol-disulfide interchange protein
MKQVCLFHRRLIVYRRAMRGPFILAALLLATPAFAGATDWQEVAPGARLRLISSDQLTPEGLLRLGIEIDMPLQMKTYWRIPGETGIPASLDFSRSEGVGEHRVLWPYPEIDQSTGYLDFVYHGPTVLPLELRPTGETMVVDLALVLGICSDICVPAQATFALPIQLATPDTAQTLRIEQAIANVPIPPDDDASIGPVAFGPDGLSVPLQSADIDPASVIAATADPAILFGAPQKSPDNDLVILPLLGGDGQQSLVGQLIEISFMTSTGPYVVERQIGSTPAAP